MPGRSQTPAGFTLIELLIVIALMTIISLISVTSYRGYMLRANRSDGAALLLRVAAAQERWYLENNRYTTDAVELGFPSKKSEQGFYDLALASPDVATTFTAIVAPVAGERQASDSDCQFLSIDESGLRSSSPKAIDVCWR